MEKNNLAEFIHFGLSYRYLKDANENFPFVGPTYVSVNIQFILSFFRKNNMKVSLNASYKLSRFLDEKSLIYTTESQNLSKEDAGELAAIMLELEIVVTNEALEVCAYFAKEKRYNSDHLFTKPSMIFGSESFAKTPKFAQEDFKEACKCILLERGTAAAFHLMRGTECTLKHLYFSVVKRNRKNPAMWGNMVPHLVERNALSAGCEGMLDVFRKGFRNPTAHPELFYSVDEAQDLLGTTTQLISLITSQKGYSDP